MVETSSVSQVLEQPLSREPLFMRRELVSNKQEFEREAAEDYWQIGLSGGRYTRDDVGEMLAPLYVADQDLPAATGDWKISDARVDEIATDTYLFTYILEAPERPATRRATLWRSSPAGGWTALHHQATPVLADPYAPPPMPSTE